MKPLPSTASIGGTKSPIKSRRSIATRSDCSSSNRSRLTTRSMAMTHRSSSFLLADSSSSLATRSTNSSSTANGNKPNNNGGASSSSGAVVPSRMRHYSDPEYGRIDPTVLADRALAKTEKALRENILRFSAMKVSVQRSLAEMAKESSTLYYALEESRTASVQLSEELQQHQQVLEEFLTLSNFAHGSPTRLHEESNERMRQRQKEQQVVVSSSNNKRTATGSTMLLSPSSSAAKADMTFVYGQSSQFSRRHRTDEATPSQSPAPSPIQVGQNEAQLLQGGDHPLFGCVPKLQTAMEQADAFIEEGESKRTQLSLMQRRLLHLSHLIDRAVENELQCLHSAVYSRSTTGDPSLAAIEGVVGPSEDDASLDRVPSVVPGSAVVYVDASPLFPEDTLQHTAEILSLASELSLSSRQLTAQLRLLSRVSVETLSDSAQELKRLLKKSLLIAETKLEEAKRQVQTVEVEEKKTQYRKQQQLAKVSALQQRLEAIDKAMAVRRAVLETQNLQLHRNAQRPDNLSSPSSAAAPDETADCVPNDLALQTLQEERDHIEHALGRLLEEVASLRQRQRTLKNEKRGWRHVLDGAQSKSEVCQSFQEPLEE